MSIDMFPDSFIQYVLDQERSDNMEHCTNCGREITVMANKNTGVCSENCRKALLGEEPAARAQVDAGVTALINQPQGINHGSII